MIVNKDGGLTPKQAGEAFQYDPNTGILTWRDRPELSPQNRSRLVGKPAGGLNHGYVRAKIDGKYVSVHRIAYAIVTGAFPKAEVDHINGDPSDNRWVNLRECTHAENSQNRKVQANNRSGYSGVCWHRASGKWMVQTSVGARNKYLGIRNTKEEAYRLYLSSRAEHHTFQSLPRDHTPLPRDHTKRSSL